MERAVGLTNWFMSERKFSKMTSTMSTLVWPLEMKNVPIGPQLRQFVGALAYQHSLLRSHQRRGTSFLLLT
jgi:hypothetical protein